MKIHNHVILVLETRGKKSKFDKIKCFFHEIFTVTCMYMFTFNLQLTLGVFWNFVASFYPNLNKVGRRAISMKLEMIHDSRSRM